jgi:hypothetical protein
VVSFAAATDRARAQQTHRLPCKNALACVPTLLAARRSVIRDYRTSRITGVPPGDSCNCRRQPRRSLRANRIVPRHFCDQHQFRQPAAYQPRLSLGVTTLIHGTGEVLRPGAHFGEHAGGPQLFLQGERNGMQCPHCKKDSSCETPLAPHATPLLGSCSSRAPAQWRRPGAAGAGAGEGVCACLAPNPG